MDDWGSTDVTLTMRRKKAKAWCINIRKEPPSECEGPPSLCWWLAVVIAMDAEVVA